MSSPWGAYLKIFTLELQKSMFYRVDFWIRAIAYPASRIFLAYFLWLSVYSATGRHTIAGYDFPALMFYYVIASVAGNVVITSPSAISEDIYQGTLTKYLLYPASFFGLKFFSGWGSGVVSLLQLIAVVGVVAAISPAITLAPQALVLGAIAIIGSRCLCFVLTSMLELVAFWADQVFNLWLMLYFMIHLMGGILLPPAMFPEWLATASRLTPFPYLVAFPSRVFAGEVGFAEWSGEMAILIGWIGAGAFMCTVLFRRGLKQYAGVGM